MPRTIDQFMWGYQHMFRAGVESGTERALKSIGAPMASRVVLVGFRVEEGRRHDICVEPENGPLTQADFDTVVGRTDDLFVTDPETQIVHSDRGLHERRLRSLYKRARATATAEAIEASSALPGMRLFASDSTLVGGYDVHTCIAVESDRIDALPAFDEDVHDRIYVGRSLTHEVIAECLRRADRALYLPNPGVGLEELGAPTGEIVRTAARTFLDGCVFRSGGQPSDLFESLVSVTSLAYERGPAHGRVVLVSPGHPRLQFAARLARHIPVRESRAVRKLLEISDPSVAILIDGRDVFGFGGATSPDEVGNDPAIFEILIPGHATFDLQHNGTALMRVAYGQSSLPRPLLDRGIFDDVVDRIIGPADKEQLWNLVDAAAGGGHGTTIVISSDAGAEAERLSGQATLMDPTSPAADDIVRFSRIDGAILLDTTAICHAIGVILDGEASGSGNPSRGSRFNSSVRYQESAVPATVVVVVSEDGSVDLVPSLHQRVSRAEVVDAMTAFRSAATSGPVDGETFARAYDAVNAYRFYLDQAQCDEVNALFNAEQDRRFSTGGIAIRDPPLHPRPEMDDSYFLPKETPGPPD